MCERKGDQEGIEGRKKVNWWSSFRFLKWTDTGAVVSLLLAIFGVHSLARLTAVSLFTLHSIREKKRREREREKGGGWDWNAKHAWPIKWWLDYRSSLSLIRHKYLDRFNHVIRPSFFLSPFSNRVTLYSFPFLFVQRKESRKTGEGTVRMRGRKREWVKGWKGKG